MILNVPVSLISINETYSIAKIIIIALHEPSIPSIVSADEVFQYYIANINL